MIYSRMKAFFILLLLTFSNTEKLFDLLSFSNESGENITNPDPKNNGESLNNLEVSTDYKCGKLNGKKCPDWQCCSIYGYCGTREEHCIKYCDEKYGLCVSTDNMCGKKNGKRCPYGQCCSKYGHCGRSEDHCVTYCDPNYGMCKSSEVSTDGKCGVKNGKRCKDDACCSKYGYCGTSGDHCIKYCDPYFSECKPYVFDDSIDGECGVKNGKKCPDGACCSIYGYCGKSKDHCTKYCDSDYSECKSLDDYISNDGLCGKKNQKLCPDGECCSTHGYCGKSDEHCITSCDPDYGRCKTSENISTDGLCGIKNGKKCPEGECCTIYGYCGTSEDHCNTYCDPDYGRCKSSEGSDNSDDISTDGECGIKNGKKCPEGECCTIYGNCGSSNDHCDTYCDSDYSKCKSSEGSDSSDDISTDGLCGSINGKKCPEGECCTIYGYCGSSNDHCITYCDPNYSRCKSSEGSDNSDDISTDDECGIKNGKKCPEGECCTIYGYCGTSDDHCITYCDPNYSVCRTADDISTDDSCGVVNGKRCPAGECCSKYGYCGSSNDHCITYCDPNYSICKSPDDTSGDNSTDENEDDDDYCGKKNGKTCPDEECCSIYGYCGTSDDHCITYCDPNYGKCKN